jgi:antitoxin component YwqK of YwqJK toxin-antitoxin module
MTALERNMPNIPFLLSLYPDYNNQNMRFLFLFSISLFMTVLIQAQSDTLFNQTDDQNLKQGWWKKSYPNGKLMYKGYFKDNKPVGEMCRYFDTGALKAILNYEGKSEYAHAQLYYADGQIAAEGWYYLSLKDSTWLYYSYYDKTLTASETYSKGIRHGTMIHYYNNGNISEKLVWKNDRKNGRWEQYFISNSPKLQGTFINNSLEGDFTVYYENGKTHVKGSYLNNQRNGTWTFYNDNGTIDMQLEYLNGKTKDESKLDEKQQQLFRMIDENRGKFEEPNETNFHIPASR